jgi:hypothetical protein
LSTPNGKYKAKKRIKQWEPRTDIFKNPFSCFIRPFIYKIRDNFIGSNIKFVIILKVQDKEDVLLLLNENGYLHNKYNIPVAKEILENKENLSLFIKQSITEGKIKCDSFEIHSCEKWLLYKDLPTYNAKKISFLKYYFFGRIKSISEKYKRMFINFLKRILNRHSTTC